MYGSTDTEEESNENGSDEHNDFPTFVRYQHSGLDLKFFAVIAVTTLICLVLVVYTNNEILLKPLNQYFEAETPSSVTSLLPHLIFILTDDQGMGDMVTKIRMYFSQL